MVSGAASAPASGTGSLGASALIDAIGIVVPVRT